MHDGVIRGGSYCRPSGDESHWATRVGESLSEALYCSLVHRPKFLPPTGGQPMSWHTAPSEHCSVGPFRVQTGTQYFCFMGSSGSGPSRHCVLERLSPTAALGHPPLSSHGGEQKVPGNFFSLTDSSSMQRDPILQSSSAKHGPYGLSGGGFARGHLCASRWR